MKMYFISGVSGVGKTTVMRELLALLPPLYEVHDFDERGVPNNAGHEWRLAETHYWIDYGRQKAAEDSIVVVCGFANPDEIAEMQADDQNFIVETILLDAKEIVIEQRLRNRNENAEVKEDLDRAVGSAEEFIQNNTRFIPVLRKICERHHCPIIDTTQLEPKAAAQQIAQLVLAR